jgi:hypothetical protein
MISLEDARTTPNQPKHNREYALERRGYLFRAIIAWLLMSLWTGRQPTKRTHEMLCLFLMGWATEDELLAHLAQLKLSDERAAAKKS